MDISRDDVKPALDATGSQSHLAAWLDSFRDLARIFAMWFRRPRTAAVLASPQATRQTAPACALP
jgi:hypothetical protein